MWFVLQLISHCCICITKMAILLQRLTQSSLLLINQYPDAQRYCLVPSQNLYWFVCCIAWTKVIFENSWIYCIHCCWPCVTYMWKYKLDSANIWCTCYAKIVVTKVAYCLQSTCHTLAAVHPLSLLCAGMCLIFLELGSEAAEPANGSTHVASCPW